MSTTTHTRVHTHIGFADPWLRCDDCGRQVRGWHHRDHCGCDRPGWQNLPCGHQAGATSVCLTWSAVRGCTCLIAHDQPGEP
jgi:hypothetical protein